MAESSLETLTVYIVMISLPSEATTLPALLVTEKLVTEESATVDVHYFCIGDSMSSFSGVLHRCTKESYKDSKPTRIGIIPLDKFHANSDKGWLQDLPERPWQDQLRDGSLLGEPYVKKVLALLEKREILHDIGPEGRAWMDRGNQADCTSETGLQVGLYIE
ncbi:hypothetical protein N7489_008447 [Penicillium chrysogenum]|uniref:uncharacterized protein n=1 Tax=Penicillium chrysogenum TaxID=5076 RepID=UPI0024DF0DDB|nr:uncharacterized protein N7489_008447 [Penicillium chrysogenum]KAJ5227739.1 hypothetical protein N7489_008447 [Penicillium chrysogenum]